MERAMATNKEVLLTLRFIYVLGLCFFPLNTLAQPPTPEAVTHYHAALDALDDAKRVSDRVLEIVKTDQPVDPAEPEALATESAQIMSRLNAHLDTAIAGEHAVAMYKKAKVLLAASILKNKQSACEFYGRAAEQGLIAGAVEYVNCIPFYPPSAEYERRLALLQATVQGHDYYESEYPLLTAFPSCFPKHKPPPKPDEDAIQWVIDNARPLALSAGDFRAEGYYILAMRTEIDEQRVNFLNLAFAQGCREDFMRVAKYVRDERLKALIKGPPLEAVR